MKAGINVLLIVVAFLGTSCRDKAIEKRLAEVESKVAQLEANKTNTNAPAGLISSATPVATKPEGPLPEIKFDNMEHNFGTVTEGQKVVHVYKVTNTGKAPLIIQKAEPSCGCTVPDWTKTPIQVGESGFVRAEFDTKGKPGKNDKTITVTANTWPATSLLKFKAEVIAKPSGANGPLAK